MPKAPADTPSNPQPSKSPTPSPEDHLRTLVEFLKPGGADLARRWVAALFLAPEAERERIVSAVERRIVELYALEDSREDEADSEPLFHVADAPIQREGRVEQTIRTYARAAEQSLKRRDEPGAQRKTAD